MAELDSEIIDPGGLRLRAPRIEDGARIIALANDFEVARMTTNLPHPFRVEDAAAFYARMEGIDRAREAVFVVDAPDAGLVGMIGMHPGALGPEIGYWIGRPYWGKGLATRAARAALDWAGRTWRKRVVVSGHFADNPASGRVLEKAGFLYTGEVVQRHSHARGQPAATRMMVWLA
jgi:RimJ/RimL family protein N-acetyltransferase